MADLDAALWTILAALAVGSFLGVVVMRVDAPASAVWGHSQCAHCRHRLAWRDLIPLVSWIATGGRCRFCGQRLGLFYPGIELAALAVALWAAAVTSGWLVWASCLLGWTLLALAAIDLRRYLLPDFLTLPLILCGIAVTALLDPAEIAGHVIGAGVGFFVVVALRAAYRLLRGREGIGLGDAKLLAASGAWVSWEELSSVVLVSALGALAYVTYRACRGKPLGASDPVPFGAFLCAGTWLIWLYGPIA